MIDCAVAVVLVENDEKYLVLERHSHDRTFPGWCLPGGKIEPDETPLVAVIREAKEETGYDIEPYDLVGVYECNIGVSRFKVHVFVAKVKGGKAKEFPNREHVQMVSFKLDEEPFNTDSISRKAMSDFRLRVRGGKYNGRL